MRIVVLDGYTLNPGDLSWEPLHQLGECSIYDRSSPDQVIDRSAGAQVLITNKVEFSAETIHQLPSLRYIGVTATGYDIIDLEAARRANVLVTNVPAYSTLSVSQMVFAHILNLTQHVGHHSEVVKDGQWTNQPDFCFWDFPLVELDGLTLGLIGFGRIGRSVADIADAFGMKVLYYDPYTTEKTGHADAADLERIFTESDIISLHCPLTTETKHLVNQQRLAKMKASAFLINTGRGPLVDETALANTLNSGLLAGAGLDVLADEPPPKDHPLYSAKNCYITPHIAWATRASRQRCLDIAVANIKAFRNGNPENVVNPH